MNTRGVQIYMKTVVLMMCIMCTEHAENTPENCMIVKCVDLLDCPYYSDSPAPHFTQSPGTHAAVDCFTLWVRNFNT